MRHAYAMSQLPPEISSSPSPEPRRSRPTLPGFVRAAIGAVATAVDDRHTLGDRALELPVLAVSTALQMSLRAQQQYAAFTARGDELLNSLGGSPEDDAPSWAKFDDEAAVDETDPGEINDGSTGDEADDAVESESDRPAPLKAVNPPRSGTPSAFDAVADPDAVPDLEGFSIPHPTED